jgi:predicted RNA methylase
MMVPQSIKPVYANSFSYLCQMKYGNIREKEVKNSVATEKDEKELRRFIKQNFKDEQKACNQFGAKYEQPPQEEYGDIVNRRDLLTPQDVRERKGSFFTPQIWVELSQKYIADVLGEDWQDEYYVWDCAAGTGNLSAGLTNKYNVWASTLDKQDVDVMHDRIKNGANLLESHVFQFDFLNDDFSKLPQGLQDMIADEKIRKKLVVYINPPYAEADNRNGKGRSDVAVSMIHKKYSDKMGYTKREIYIQFLTRIYCEIYGCMLADFSTLKNLQAPRFADFRNFFRAKLEKIFLVPAATFDNVKGVFPIGFKIWNTNITEDFKHISADIYNEKGKFVATKNIWAYDDVKFINDWVKTFRYSKAASIATIIGVGNDFQNQRLVRFGEPYMKVPADNHNWQITTDNLIESCIYFAVRKCIESDWLNNRDQFLYPYDGWKTDLAFQNDCLAYTLFGNNIQSKYGVNHWIPFTKDQVAACDKFDSNFMTDFIAGKASSIVSEPDLFYFAAGNSGGSGGGYGHAKPESIVRTFSSEATEVFNAGKVLWKYYHQQPNSNVNASLYDIREHFQGRNEKDKMNPKSENGTYMELITELRDKLKLLAKKIEPKVYEYGFLKG